MAKNRIYSVGVNLVFKNGLDPDKHRAELKALHDAIAVLGRISKQQLAPEVEGQEGTGEQSSVPCQAVYDGTDPRPLDGDAWMYVTTGN